MTVPISLRRIVAVVARISVVPAVVSFRLRMALFGEVAAITGSSEKASKWSGTAGILRRRALYGTLLATVGEKFSVGFGTVMSSTRVRIGHRVYIGQHCSLGQVEIGDDSMVADHVVIPSGARQHGTARTDVPMRLQPGESAIIRIGQDCWVGSGAIVLADVGDHAIVAAGAIVTKPVPAYSVVAGGQARVVTTRGRPGDPGTE